MDGGKKCKGRISVPYHTIPVIQPYLSRTVSFMTPTRILSFLFSLKYRHFLFILKSSLPLRPPLLPPHTSVSFYCRSIRNLRIFFFLIIQRCGHDTFYKKGMAIEPEFQLHLTPHQYRPSENHAL